jgi:anti-sigma B factor antagonist
MVGSMTSFGRRLRRRRNPPSAPAQPARPLAVEVSAADFGTLVDVSGEVEVATSPQLRAALAARPRVSGGLLVLDLTGVTFLDSSGLSAVLTLQRESAAAGERLAVICPSGPARLLFEVTGVDAELPLYATRDAALAAR